MIAHDVELQLVDGSWLGLMLAPPERDGDPRTIDEALTAAVAETPISDDLHEVIQEDWSGGVGIDYDGAYGLYTRSRGGGRTKDGKRAGGFVCPAGAATNVPLPSGAGDEPSNSPIVAFAEFEGDLYVGQEGANATNGGRIMRITGGTGSAAQVFDLSTTNFYVRDLTVASDGTGAMALFASVSDDNGLNGVLYRTYDGSSWTSSTTAFGGFGTNGRNRTATVYWKTEDAVGGTRMVSISGPNTVAYTIADDSDPLDDAQWQEGVRIGTIGSLREIVAFRRHVFFGADDDLWDLNEVGESQAMTTYLSQMLQRQSGTATYAVQPLNGYIYIAAGRSLVRVYVGDPGALDEDVLDGQCAPGWGTAAEGLFRGIVTAMTVDQGYLVAAVADPNTATGKSYIFWGIDRRVVGVDTPNPLVWYGPEVVLTGGHRVTALHVSNLNGDLRLWIGSQSMSTFAPRLDWVSLPIAGQPIQDFAAAGSHRFAPGDTPSDVVQPSCQLELLRDSSGDKATTKHLYQYTIGSRGLDAGSGTKLTLQARADPAPGSSSYTSQGDVTAGPTQTVTPATVVSGNTTQQRIDFVSPVGDATLAQDVKFAVLDSIRRLEWRVAPSLNLLTLPVRYGEGVADNDGREDEERSPDWKTAALKALTEARTTTLRDRNDQRYTVKLRQVLDGRTEYFDGGTWNKRVTKRLQVTVLAGPL